MFWPFKYRAKWEDRMYKLSTEARQWEKLYSKERVNNGALYRENQRLQESLDYWRALAKENHGNV